MKPFRGEAAVSVPATPVPGAHERGTVWSANVTPASTKSYTTTPLVGSVAPSMRTIVTTDSTGGFLNQNSSHSLELFAPFPATVSDALRRLPAFDAAHLAGGLDTQSGFAWVVINDVNFKSQRKLLIWNYQLGSSVGPSRSRPGASNDVFQLTMPGSVSDPMPSADLVAVVSTISIGSSSSPFAASTSTNTSTDARGNLGGVTSASSSSSTVMGVVAASTHGQLRYWPRMTEIHRCTDATVQLQANETCVSLRALHGAPVYILATSTGRIILIAFQGTHSVLQREIKSQKSMFKKVGSWFGFGGANQIVSPDQRLVGVRVSPHADGGAHLWLLKTDSLQIWYFDNQSRESLVFDKNIVAEFESHIYETQEQQYGGRIPLDLTVVDFHIQSGDHHNPGRVCLLIGAVPAETEDENILQLLDQRGDHGEYYLAVYEASFSSNLPITAAGSATIQLISTLYIPEEVAASSEYPMLMVPPDEPVVYIHWEHFAISIPIPNPSEVPVDIIDITGNPSYRIFGSSSLSNATLYFTPNHGIVKFKILPSTLASILGESHPDRKPSKVSSSHAVGFMSQASAEDIISEAFHRYMTQPSSQHLSSPSTSYPWSPLIDMVWNLNYSDAVKSFSQRIADSSPTEDPRWPEFAGIDASSNLGHQGQLQSFLHRQIEEKQQTLENFVRFLGEVGIWSELPLAIRDSIEQTAERLAGASLLRSHHNDLIITMQRQHGSSLVVTPRTASANHLVIFNQSIEAALNSRGISRTQWERDGLGAQDIFYAQVSKIETILEPALAVLKAQLAQKLSQESQFTLISQANFLFESVIVAAQAYRLAHSQEYYPSSNPEGEVYPSDYLRAFAGRSDSNLTAPWTFAFHSTVREMARITRQFVEQVKQSKAAASQKTLGKGFASSTDVDVELLDEQLFRLSDAILADLHQEIVRRDGESGVEEMKAQFATIRVECIAPFKTDPSQYEQALHLAEKYQDFAALIEICQATNDDRRLWRYAEQFKEDRFEIVVFEHFFVNKQYHKLLTPPHIYWKSLTEYLNDTPQANFLSWVHQIQTGDFGSAERTFDLLAQTELHSTFKQRTLLSLAKISHFAQKSESGDAPALSNMALESVEARQQKLYQINAQTLIRAMLDSTDEDAPPLPSIALVKRLLDVAHGTDHLEPGSSLQLALDLYRNTTLLRSEFGNQDMLKNIWHKVLSLEHWNELADMLQRGQMDDDTLRDEIERSIFFRTAYATQSIEDELPSALFIEVVKSFQYNAATRRTLSTALSLVYEARDLPLPNLSELIHSSDEPQQQQELQDEVVVIEDSDEDQGDLAQGTPAEIGTMDQS